MNDKCTASESDLFKASLRGLDGKPFLIPEIDPIRSVFVDVKRTRGCATDSVSHKVVRFGMRVRYHSPSGESLVGYVTADDFKFLERSGLKTSFSLVESRGRRLTDLRGKSFTKEDIIKGLFPK